MCINAHAVRVEGPTKGAIGLVFSFGDSLLAEPRVVDAACARFTHETGEPVKDVEVLTVPHVDHPDESTENGMRRLGARAGVPPEVVEASLAAARLSRQQNAPGSPTVQ